MGKLLHFRKLKSVALPTRTAHVEVGSAGETIIQRLYYRNELNECRFSIEQTEELIAALSECVADAKCRRSQRESGQ